MQFIQLTLAESRSDGKMVRYVNNDIFVNVNQICALEKLPGILGTKIYLLSGVKFIVKESIDEISTKNRGMNTPPYERRC